jgi:hypothetical protein
MLLVTTLICRAYGVSVAGKHMFVQITRFQIDLHDLGGNGEVMKSRDFLLSVDTLKFFEYMQPLGCIYSMIGWLCSGPFHWFPKKKSQVLLAVHESV